MRKKSVLLPLTISALAAALMACTGGNTFETTASSATEISESGELASGNYIP